MFNSSTNMDDNILLSTIIQDQQLQSSIYSYSNDSDEESDDDGNDMLVESYNKGSNKRRKLSDEERLKRCRER